MALTPKQERFVAEYLVDLNATAASIRAGYKEKTAAQMGYKLLQTPKVQAAIQEAQADLAKRTEITQEYVLKKLKEIADKEAGDYQDSPLKYSSKIRALELLGKHLGIFEPKSTVIQRDTEDDPLTASLKEWMKENGAKGDI